MKILTTLGLCAAAVIAAGCRHETADVEPPTPKVNGETIVFQTNAPQLGSLNVQPAQTGTALVMHLAGRLSWNENATVRIFTPVAGRVIAVHAELGQAISVDAPLADIDSPDFGQAIANARAAAGNLAAADKTLSRSKDLLTHGAAAQKDVEAAEAAYDAALAERDRAYAVLANYGGSERSTNSIYTLRSPIAGSLVEKNINPGQEVRADQMLANATPLYAPLFVVSDPAKLWVQLDASELDLQALHAGERLVVHCLAYPDRTFDGELEHIAAELDPSTRTMKVQGRVSNPDKLLKAEMYVTVDVIGDSVGAVQAAVEVPARAVFMQDNQNYVFIEQSSGQFLRQLIKIGPEQDGKVPVLQGVLTGQKVVTEGCLLLESLLESNSKS